MKTATQKLHNFQTMSCSGDEAHMYLCKNSHELANQHFKNTKDIALHLANELAREARENSEAQKQNKALQKQNKALQKQNKALQEENKALQEEIYRLRTAATNESQKQLSRGRLESAGFYGVQFDPNFSYAERVC